MNPVTPRIAPLAMAVAVVGLLGCHWLLATTAVAGKSATFDEPAHLGAGFSYWRLNDYRLWVENGLPQRLAALPLLLMAEGTPQFSEDWKVQGSVWTYGESVLAQAGTRAASVLLAARMTIALMGVALAGLAWGWSRRMHGPIGGLVSLTACCFEPSILANTPLTATDVSVTCTMFAASIAVWNTLERVTLARVCLSCLAVAALLLTKWTGALIVPITGLLVVARLVRGTPLAIGDRRQICSRAGQGMLFAGLALVHVAAVWVAMWASVGFRFGPTPSGVAGDAVVREQWNQAIFEKEYAARPAIDWLRARQAVPETFLVSFAATLQAAGMRRAFLFGEVRETGFTWFFPYCLWAKTNPALFVLLAVAAAAAIRHGRRRGDTAWLAAPLLAVLAVYGTTALTSRLNIGQRHLLPMFPALFVLAGGAGLAVTAQGRSPLDRGLRWLTLAAVAAYPVTAVMVWPDYLAYFNSLSGGSATAYRRLVDSSLDWGQELVSLERWLRRNGLPAADTPVYLSAFSSVPPEHYGLKVRPLRSFFGSKTIVIPQPLEPGVYCVSATMLSGAYSGVPGDLDPAEEEELRELEAIVRRLHAAGEGSELWRAMMARRPDDEWQLMFDVHAQLRFIKLCSMLRKLEPDIMLGSAMLIYRLSAADLATLE